MPERRVIAHLDCDSFYASVELLRRPELRGRPVVVAGAGPRAVVTTASYEARRFGVHSATPASRARRLCPQAVFIAPDFAAYRAKSKEVWGIVSRTLECPLQQVSLDEAYLDVTAVGRPLAALRGVVARVAEQTGITVSVGVGPSRLVAKTASDWRKPACFEVLSRRQACEAFAGSPTRILQGVGPKTQERLRSMGIATVGELQRAPVEELERVFGARLGRWLRERAHFVDDSPVEVTRVAKSRSGEITFDHDVLDLARLEQTVERLATDVCEGLRRAGSAGRTVQIKLRYDDWTNVTRARTLERATADTAQVAAVAIGLLRANAPPRPVRLIGVRVAALEPVAADRASATREWQLSLPL